MHTTEEKTNIDVTLDKYKERLKFELENWNCNICSKFYEPFSMKVESDSNLNKDF